MVPLNKVRPERNRDGAGDKKVEGRLFSVYTKRAVGWVHRFHFVQQAVAVKYVVNNFILENRQFYFLRYTEG